MAATVEDLAVVWQALAPRRPAELETPSGRLRFGTVEADLTRRVTGDQAEAIASAGRALAAAGAHVEPVALPETDECWGPYVAIQSAEAYALHRRRVESAPELFDPEVLERLGAAASVTGWQYVEALEERRRLRDAVHARTVGLDFLLLPTVPVTAPRVGSRGEPLGAGWENPREALLALTSPWSVLGLPAVSVPVPRPGGGLPVAVQVVGRHGEDDLLLHAAGLLERSLRGG
jgi:aspartyl-tRNA(Asn)/glutamyl-tRNA(Gln) amidotransferase subunit A